MADTDQLREALASIATAAQLALGALDSPEPEPETVDIGDIIEAETEATESRIEAETEQIVEVIEAQAEADADRIAAEVAAEVAVIEAEADAVVEVADELVDQADDDDGLDVLDCPDDLDLGGLGDALADLADDALDVLDGPADDAPLDIPDVAPAATHWYTRRRRFLRK